MHTVAPELKPVPTPLLRESLEATIEFVDKRWRPQLFKVKDPRILLNASLDPAAYSRHLAGMGIQSIEVWTVLGKNGDIVAVTGLTQRTGTYEDVLEIFPFAHVQGRHESVSALALLQWTEKMAKRRGCSVLRSSVEPEDGHAGTWPALEELGFRVVGDMQKGGASLKLLEKRL